MGTNGRTLASPPEVFRIPLYKAASHVVLIHNHLSSTLKPSENDLDITNRLIQAGLMMDIEVIDHVIVTKHSYYSFLDKGLIEKLRWDKKYALTFIRDKQIAQEIEKIKKEAEKHQKLKLKEGIKIGEDKGKIEGAKKEKREIAKQMLIKKMDLKLIQELTDLSTQWIGRLKAEAEQGGE